ncbi:MAG: hypothetical protein ACLSFT_02690 [Ruminococcus callidus]
MSLPSKWQGTGHRRYAGKKEIAIGAEETAEELYERLSELCVETLSETLEQLEAGPCRALRRTMHSPLASRITKEMSALDFTRPAAELHNLIRGITGFTMLEGKRLKVYGSRVVEGVSGEAGTIAEPEDFVVACGDGNGLRFTEFSRRANAAWQRQIFSAARS